MASDPFHPAHLGHPSDGIALIPEVTSEMMDDVAHRAAELADGVAHGTVTVDAPAAVAFDREPDEGRAPTGESTTLAAAAAVQHAVEGSTDPLHHASGTHANVGGDGTVHGNAVEVAGRTVEAAEAGLSSATDALGRYNAKLFAFAQSNMAATGDLFRELMQARSVSEAVSLNVEHLRRRADAVTEQSRELAALAQQMALDVLKPFRDVIARGPGSP